MAGQPPKKEPMLRSDLAWSLYRDAERVSSDRPNCANTLLMIEVNLLAIKKHFTMEEITYLVTLLLAGAKVSGDKDTELACGIFFSYQFLYDIVETQDELHRRMKDYDAWRKARKGESA